MLALYRSAIEITREWATVADGIDTPGLAIIPMADWLTVTDRRDRLPPTPSRWDGAAARA